MTPDFVLGPALLEAVRQVVREELQSVAPTVAAPTGPGLLTPAEASERLGGRPSQKTIREWIHVGRLPKRTNNLGMDPKRPNFLVALEEVRAAMERRADASPPTSAPASLDMDAARARARELVAKTGRGGRGGW